MYDDLRHSHTDRNIPMITVLQLSGFIDVKRVYVFFISKSKKTRFNVFYIPNIFRPGTDLMIFLLILFLLFFLLGHPLQKRSTSQSFQVGSV